MSKRLYELTVEEEAEIAAAAYLFQPAAARLGPRSTDMEKVRAAWSKVAYVRGFDMETVRLLPEKGPRWFEAEPLSSEPAIDGVKLVKSIHGCCVRAMTPDVETARCKCGRVWVQRPHYPGDTAWFLQVAADPSPSAPSGERQ